MPMNAKKNDPPNNRLTDPPSPQSGNLYDRMSAMLEQARGNVLRNVTSCHGSVPQFHGQK